MLQMSYWWNFTSLPWIMLENIAIQTEAPIVLREVFYEK